MLISLMKKEVSINCSSKLFLYKLATLRNRQKLAAHKKQNCEEHPRSNLAQNSNIPRSQQDHNTEISEEIENRVTKTCPNSLAGRRAIFLGARSCPDDFLLNPLTQATPEPLQRRPGTHYIQIREQMGTTPRVILNRMWMSLRVRLQNWHG